MNVSSQTVSAVSLFVNRTNTTCCVSCVCAAQAGMAPIAIVREISRTANIHVVDFIFLRLSMLIVLLNKLVC